ncbi:MAG: hypothetical protein WDM81_02640 [Rhizomicrobium sp.]
MPLLHRLQQRRLGARGGTVDLVGHQQLGEHRPRDEAEAALAAGLLQHFGANDIGRHQVGRELDALPVQAQDDAQRLHQLGLGEARHADQKPMPAGQQRHQRLLDHRVLAEDRPPDRLAHLGQRGRGALEMGGGARTFSHDVVHKGVRMLGCRSTDRTLSSGCAGTGPIYPGGAGATRKTPGPHRAVKDVVQST